MCEEIALQQISLQYKRTPQHMRYENEHRFRQTGLDGFRTQSTYNCHSSLGLLILHRHVVSFRYLVSSFFVTIYSHILYHTQLPQWCDARRYHWRELPPVSFLSRQKCLSRQNPSFVATKVCLSRQKWYLSQQNIFVNKSLLLSRQTRVCRDNNDTCGSSHHWYGDSLALASCVMVWSPELLLSLQQGSTFSLLLPGLLLRRLSSFSGPS